MGEFCICVYANARTVCLAIMFLKKSLPANGLASSPLPEHHKQNVSTYFFNFSTRRLYEAIVAGIEQKTALINIDF